ncbi:hypothetical protein H1W37_17675 [Stappia taiwanensis]|uniref:Uncharacterized protein n=1 Tax=Stappia taiwanensis TaxID=992267 RepID=A0A838XT07_9HYPH|nr:hypothetical protein [Stappia taiwanensis]MBA4613492.1 hypothetical protein [Stappia taiwanensis]GGF02720.1 hypothetical protein GCM10007285_33050 [Stappia taiwanensis]
MWDFSIGGALGMMMRTTPFIIFRMTVYFGIALGYILVTGTGVGIGYGIGGFGDEEFRATSTFWGGAVGFGLFGAVMYWVREYILYMVKAGHVAVLVQLIDGKPMPGGKRQISYATEVVKERFVQTNVLFALDQLVKGVIGAITGLVRGILTILPIPGAQQLAGILHAFLRIAVGFIDEVILAHAIRTQSTNAWGAAKDALVLYGQNYKVMLKNAAWLAIIVYGLGFIVFLVMLAPAALVVYLMPGAWAAGGIVFALLFAWAVKAALLEPFAIACLMQVYFKTIEGQEPDPEWDARLEQMSAKFRKLKARALGGDRQQGADTGDLRPA